MRLNALELVHGLILQNVSLEMICAKKIVVIKKDADVFALLARVPIFFVVSKTTKDMMCIDYWSHIQVTANEVKLSCLSNFASILKLEFS